MTKYIPILPSFILDKEDLFNADLSFFSYMYCNIGNTKFFYRNRKTIIKDLGLSEATYTRCKRKFKDILGLKKVKVEGIGFRSCWFFMWNPDFYKKEYFIQEKQYTKMLDVKKGSRFCPADNFKNLYVSIRAEKEKLPLKHKLCLSLIQYNRGRMSIRDLCNVMKCSASTVNKILKELSEKDYIIIKVNGGKMSNTYELKE